MDIDKFVIKIIFEIVLAFAMFYYCLKQNKSTDRLERIEFVLERLIVTIIFIMIVLY